MNLLGKQADAHQLAGVSIMRLRFLGKNTGSHQSPTLYASDHSTYVLCRDGGYRATQN